MRDHGHSKSNSLSTGFPGLNEEELPALVAQASLNATGSSHTPVRVATAVLCSQVTTLWRGVVSAVAQGHQLVGTPLPGAWRGLFEQQQLICLQAVTVFGSTNSY